MRAMLYQRVTIFATYFQEICSKCHIIVIMFTCGVLKDFNGAIVDLSNGLHLNVVAIATIKPLSVDIMLKILISHILGKVVHVLKLEGGREREREKERCGKGSPH